MKFLFRFLIALNSFVICTSAAVRAQEQDSTDTESDQSDDNNNQDEVSDSKDSTALPATDIYLVDITLDKKGNQVFENPALITKNENYDNEPWWYPDGSAILFASVRDSSARDSSKADIYKYDLRTHKTSVVINTPKTAEFSP